ncbi:flagellar biosynthesis protein [Clostridium sp. HBUAS56017]|uniref:FliH/SctL family protein n=1 Tax=Clostridium sp. HBUAS56017 TaxID=2571128 RepID=UPI0011787EBB|nr:flagellar biosynthesis protein [Clostridium sp. HBUAS56017]
MQSSYNLVKKEHVLSGESRVISTEYESKNTEKGSQEDHHAEWKAEKQRYISSYENIARNIVQEARRNGEKIRLEAIEEAEALEREAYEKGYKQGTENGYEDGKREALESIIPQAEKEAEEIKEKARNILLGATNDYNSYVNSKKNDIIKLSLTIAEKILRREVLVDGGINSMIEEAFEKSKGEASVIIRCNEVHEEEVREKIEFWKTTYSISEEIFLMISDEIEPGNAIIQKNTGKIEVGIDFGLESIKKAIIG